MGARDVRPKRTKAGTSRGAAATRRALFVEAYIGNGRNATEAAKAAGYSPKTAYAAGARLLRDVQVRQLIEGRTTEVLAKAKLTVEGTLREVARIAYFDPRRLFDESGKLKPIHELDDDTAAALAGIEVLEEYQGTGSERVLVGYTTKVKHADKNAALDKAMKHLGLYEQDNEQLGNAIARAIIVPAKRPAGYGIS